MSLINGLLFIVFFILFHFNLHAIPLKDQGIKVNPGENAVLPCSVRTLFRLLEWVKHDPKPEETVFVLRNGNKLDEQSPSFRGRVELKDPEMKHGDVSVILKNVTIGDNGTYACRASVSNGEDVPALFCTIELKVDDTGDSPNTWNGGNSPGHLRLVGILAVVVVLVFEFYV